MILLSAIEQVVEAAENSGLSEEFMEKVKRPVGYICRKLPMNRIQAVLFALFVDRSDNHRIKIGDLAGYVKCRNVRIMKYMNEIDALERSHYLRCIRGKENTSYRVPQAVVSALKNDKPFVPQTYENITATAFFCVLHEMLERRDDDEISTEALTEEIEMLMEDNPQLEFVRQVRKMQLFDDYRQLVAQSEEAARLHLQLTENEVENTAEQYFWQLISLQEKMKTIAAVDTMLSDIHKDVDVAVRAGVALNNDLLQVQLRQNEVESQRLKQITKKTSF